VAITSDAYLSTPLTAAAAEPAPAEDAAAQPDRVGVVFVHGIGAQPAAETFLDWSAPIVELLADWRAEHGLAADPVVRSEFSFSGSSQPFLELDIPAHAGRPAARWVLTEAWWAAEVRPQRLRAVIGYVRRGLPRILGGLRDAYLEREASWDSRLAREHVAANQAAGAARDEETKEQAALIARTTAPGAGWAWVEVLDSIQRRLSILAIAPAVVVGSAILLLYSLLELVPISRIRRFAVLRQAESFMTDWFGDLPTLLDDRVQSANIRARLANAIARLESDGCGRIVLVAHSGGAIVSFMTLLDPAYARRRVDKLITLGQGLSVAWRLVDAAAGLPTGHRLTGDLTAARSTLRWADYWASYDPAPAGSMKPPPGVTARVESFPVTNRMNLVEDHGAYWSNDEGFVMPVLRHIDSADRDTDESRFFRNGGLRISRIEWRRQRVGVLAAWRWLVGIAAVVVIGAAVIVEIVGLPGSDAGLGRLSRAVGAWLGTVPGSELVATVIAALERAGLWPAALLTWVVGVIAAALPFVVLGRLGGAAWTRWDDAERRRAHRRILQLPDRQRAWLVAGTFVIGLAALTVVIGRYLLA